MADSQSIVFFDNVTKALIDGDLIKVQCFRLDGEGAPEPAGVLVMTRWAATLLVADVYNTMKKKPKSRTSGEVIAFRKVEKTLTSAPTLNGA